MKQRIIIFFTTFIYFIFLFNLSKVAFILMNAPTAGSVTIADVLSVLYHGLPLDVSISGYLTIIPGLVLIASIWFKSEIVIRIFNVYFGTILLLIVIVTVSDIAIYPYWGFHYDASIFLYLKKPEEAFASVSVWTIVLGILIIAITTVVLYMGYYSLIISQVSRLEIPRSIKKTAIVLFLLLGALFLPIRGGVKVSTMNVGKVYFSDRIFLNHAAINPHFNLMYSLFKSNDFASQYQFYDISAAQAEFKKLIPHSFSDSIPQLLNTKRPNIIVFILESFSENVALDSVIAPHMSSFAKDGVLFKNFYANSFRTDRGLVSILSGYPAHPTVAIMKYPQKTESLPSIPKSLKAAGYEDIAFYYGGDIDFANMRSYLIGSCGIQNIISDRDFTVSQRLTKWGVPDQFLINKLYSDLVTKQQDVPFVKVVLTLSSHEPFDVPVNKFEEPFLNAVSYTDKCLGEFIKQFRQTPLWNNTLIIVLADHAMQSYPRGLENNTPQRFRIPMIWLGGAVAKPEVISDYGSQNDLAATLLSQLSLNYDQFSFSKDMLNSKTNKFAFYSYVNGFSLLDSTGMVTYDNDKQEVIHQWGNLELEKKAKVFFQNMYLDLGRR